MKMNNFDLIFLFFSLLLAIFVLITLLFFFLTPSSIKSYISGAPPVPTPKKVIRTALKEAGLKSGDLYFDLGSGSGRSLIIAAEEFGAQVVGIEHSRPNAFVSKINLKIRGIKGEIICQNLLESDLSKADVVFAYLSISLMKKLEKKIQREKLSFKVVSYSFSFPNLKEVKRIKMSSGKSIFIYEL